MPHGGPEERVDPEVGPEVEQPRPGVVHEAGRDGVGHEGLPVAGAADYLRDEPVLLPEEENQ